MLMQMDTAVQARRCGLLDLALLRRRPADHGRQQRKHVHPPENPRFCRQPMTQNSSEDRLQAILLR